MKLNQRLMLKDTTWDNMKVREFKDKNYKAIFHNGKTIRIATDASKLISELDYPEFYDVAINNKCKANCSYCYVSAMKGGENWENVTTRISNFFSKMTTNQRPFQVAIGGHGEPTLHPDFIPVLETFHKLGIVPNYTTNGMHVTNDIIDATKKYSGGVAISCHPHLDKTWKQAVVDYSSAGIKTNLHIIVGESGSVDRFKDIYAEFENIVDYFVILPYMAVGRAKEIEVKNEWDKLFKELKDYNRGKVAFGALFYPYLKDNEEGVKYLDISLYEPELMSGYIMFDVEEPIVRKSSYDLEYK
jgi:MoaA/NifB/PqqE/SkfB family radical SAM enzyme